MGLNLLIAVDVVHLGSEGLSRLPASGLAGRNFVHELISLFERELESMSAFVSLSWDTFAVKTYTLELRNEEVGKGDAKAAQRTPKEEDLGTQVGLVLADQVGGDD